MKRSGSRVSKVSIEAQDSLENSFPGIPDAKWHEFLEKEETDFFILGLREEIVQKCLDICFDSYLERQAVAFTVHCAYLAMCKVLNVYYMVRDPGDSDDCKEKKSWEPDPEPEPSIIDSWGSHCMPLFKPEIVKKTEEVEKEICVSPVCNSESVDICSFMSDIFDFGEGEYFFSPPIFSVSSASLSRKSSLCMSLRSFSVKITDLGPCRDLNNKSKPATLNK